MIKKICVMTSVHNLFDIRIYHKEVKSLLSAGYRIYLIAQSGDAQIEEIRLIPINPAPNRFTRFFLVMPKIIIATFKQKADVYHFHDPDLIVAGFLLKIFTSSKVVYDVHEDVPKQILSKIWLPAITRKPISAIFDILEKKIAKTFDAVIVATPSIAKSFSGCKVTCIANYPKLEYFDDIVSQKKESTSREFRVIYAGGLDKMRGIREIVKAYGLISDKENIKMVLAGQFSEELFKKEITESDEWKKINYLGLLPLKDVYKEMVSADAGIICFLPEPNHIEALPNKIFEYMAAGIPIIASDFPLWKEIIEKRGCGICVEPQNPKSIAKALSFLAENPDKARRMGENGRKAVREVYNWEKESQKLLNLYRDFG